MAAEVHRQAPSLVDFADHGPSKVNTPITLDWPDSCSGTAVDEASFAEDSGSEEELSDLEDNLAEKLVDYYLPGCCGAQTKVRVHGRRVKQRATCSLNLLRYRAGTEGWLIRQIRVTCADKYTNDEGFQKTLSRNKDLAFDDRAFFLAIRSVYTTKMCSFWFRWLSLKSLHRITLVSYSKDYKLQAVPFDDLAWQQILYLYKNPAKIKSEHEWIDWVFRLRQNDRRHALHFVEGWCGTRIAILGSIPPIAATIVGILWATHWGDTQTAFTVAEFILIVGTSLLALLAIMSSIDY